MALSVSLVCDACSSKTDAVSCTDIAPRGTIKSSGLARGWKRVKVARDQRQDFCPDCAAKLPKPRRETPSAGLARRRRDSRRPTPGGGTILAFVKK